GTCRGNVRRREQINIASTSTVSLPLPGTRSAIAIADRIAIGVIAIVAVIALMTFRDYGLGWDDYTHSQYGDLLLKLYGSGFAHRPAPSFLHPYQYCRGVPHAAP